MATVVNFHGKNYIEPGSYAVSVYNPTSVVNVSEFGNVMIIDTGLAKNGTYEFAGGSGIHGELNKGLKSVYEFDNYEDFLSFMGGGLVGDIAEKIFTPMDGVSGAPKLFYCRAATTTCANITLQFGAGNSLVLKCKNEGIAGNGVIESGQLKVGYAARVVAGTEDSSKFKCQIYKGNFMGVDDAGEPYGSYSYDKASGNLLTESEEFTTLQELYDWARADKYTLANFVVNMTGQGETKLTAVSLLAATGGKTDWLKDTEYADALEAISELDVTFFIATNTTVDKGIDAATTGRLFTFLKNDAKFTEFLIIPGGSSDTDLFGESETSQAIAKYYNSGQVAVIHGAPVVNRKDGNGTKQLSSIYLTAAVVGLNAGTAPQTPLTFKRVGYQSFVYDLKKKEREKALQAGIMHVRNVSGYWCINQGVTTLQDNKKSIANDGQSMELSIELIKAQLNKELIVDSQTRFAGNNTATASAQTVKNFVETKLASLTATTDVDNLIVAWKNVKVAQKNSDYFVTYDFSPNLPVNKLFFTGNIVDLNVTA
nr:MAG TPA: hypothetical protein [Caudoviricetes sp.]